MTNRATNEAIANWFEPKPDYVGYNMDSTTAKSPLGFWEGDWDMETKWGKKGNWNWKGVHDFDTDEAASAMLLEAMAAKLIMVQLTSTEGGYDVEVIAVGHTSNKNFSVSNADRKRAIVLAFCRWAKIDAGGEA